MNKFIDVFCSIFSIEISSSDLLVMSQLLFTVLLASFAIYHFDKVKKEALKAEKIVVTERTRDH